MTGYAVIARKKTRSIEEVVSEPASIYLLDTLDWIGYMYFGKILEGVMAWGKRRWGEKEHTNIPHISDLHLT